MAALAGRALRIKISLDGGTTFPVITGSTSDNFTITREGINITDKDDLGVQTFIGDNLGTWAMEGGFEGFTKDTGLITLIMSTTQFTYDCEIDVGGLGTFTGSFGFTTYGNSGAEGAEAVNFTGSLVSSGTITFA